MGEPLVAPMKDCKNCAGTGWDVRARAIFVCDVCRGKGYVVMEICKGCGLPAYEQTSQCVPYCGDEKCFAKLVNVIDPAKKVTNVTVFPIANGFTSAMDARSMGRVVGRRGMTDAEFNAHMDRWRNGEDVDEGGIGAWAGLYC